MKIEHGSAWGPVILPVFKTGGRRVCPSPVRSTRTRFRHLKPAVTADHCSKKTLLAGTQAWAGYFMVGFSVLWTAAAFIGTYSQYHEAQTAYREGRYSIVEGVVEDFQPMPYEGHSEECFTVSGVRFCYSDYVVTAGFNQSTSHGGPIRQGLPVRIAFSDGAILRIDIPSDKIPPTWERQARAIGARKESEERTARDPQLDRMTLGFGLAVVLWTLWWNLDWLRFMKFWVKPPYKHRTVIIFRVLFAMWFLGAVQWFIENLLRTSRPGRAYLQVFGIGAAWSLVIWVMVNIVEWMNRKRHRTET